MQLLLSRFGSGGGWKETHKLLENNVFIRIYVFASTASTIEGGGGVAIGEKERILNM